MTLETQKLIIGKKVAVVQEVGRKLCHELNCEVSRASIMLQNASILEEEGRCGATCSNMWGGSCWL
jgi:hypothetical protein